MQSKDELEKWYSDVDPWKYNETPDDALRKEKILSYLSKRYQRALDLGAGEGFITKDLPADEIFAYEISDTAASRLPGNVKRINKPEGKYDLIIATGVMYPQYNAKELIDIILKHASGDILLSNIADWEVSGVELLGKPKKIEYYQYRNYVQRLRFYTKSV